MIRQNYYKKWDATRTISKSCFTWFNSNPSCVRAPVTDTIDRDYSKRGYLSRRVLWRLAGARGTCDLCVSKYIVFYFFYLSLDVCPRTHVARVCVRPASACTAVPIGKKCTNKRLWSLYRNFMDFSPAKIHCLRPIYSNVKTSVHLSRYPITRWTQ